MNSAARSRNTGRQAGRIRAVRSFQRGDEGAAVVEYAVLLAVLVGAVLLGLEMVGRATSDTFAQVTDAGIHASADAVPDTVDLAAQPDPAAVLAAKLMREAMLWRWAALAAVLITGASTWYALRRRRKRGIDEEEEEEELAAEEAGHDYARIHKKRQGILNILSADVGKLLHSRLLVEHVMSDSLTTVSPTAPRSQICCLMDENKLRHVLVCDDKGRLLGIISDRDVHGKICQTAKEMMTADPLTVAPDTPISPAVTLLVHRRISCLPVVEGDRLVGVLTTTDLLMVLQCALQAMQRVAAVAEDHPIAAAADTVNARNQESTISQHEFAGTSA